tara:strand:+ start:3081 stop:4748 length:1668 start_codon:yes stop_codon:yes gene_type:complete
MKHTFNRLARGVKLQVGHIYWAVTAALDNLTDKAGTFDGVVADQMGATDAPFTIHLSVPNFDANRLATSIPFVLPAYQDDPIWTNYYSGQETVVFKIEDVGFYFDSRDELAGVGATNAIDFDKLVFGGLGNYGLDVSILETEQKGRGYTGTNQSRYTTVWSNTIPATAWEAGLNPHTFSEISSELSPMRTYILRVVAPDLATSLMGNDLFALPNLNIWMKLSTKVVPRDVHDPSGGKYVQNIPSIHNGAVQTTPITVTSPVGGDLIKADAATPADTYDGVQTALGKVDKIFRDKLRGGYNIHSELPADENLTDGSAYKVIAVPMWGNRNGDITDSTAGTLPYAGSGPAYSAMTVDRRVIPISNNFTVHHVIACANYGDDNNFPHSPGGGSTTFKHHVGVGIGSGLRSDLHTYQQVAYNTWSPYDSGVGPEIDTCHVTLNDTLSDFWEIVSIPLVEITGEVSQNYGQQGKPFFIGQARAGALPGTISRVNVGAVGGVVAPGVPPSTDGQESFIEVRWGIQDTVGLGTLASGEVIVPHYGNWVYLIGKTTLVTANQE